MSGKFRQVRALSWEDRGLLLQAWVLLLAVDLGLRVLPFRRVQALVARGQRGAGDTPAGEAAATSARLERLVGIAARHHLYPMRCLRRALALQWLLGRRGIAAELRLGVRKEADHLAAHAWLECAGRPLGEPPDIDARYVPLATHQRSMGRPD